MVPFRAKKFLGHARISLHPTSIPIFSYVKSLPGLYLISHVARIESTLNRGFIKDRALGKLTGCEQDLAISLPGCFHLLFLLFFS